MWILSLFCFNDTATTEIYTLSLHDALPIWAATWCRSSRSSCTRARSPASSCRESRAIASEPLTIAVTGPTGDIGRAFLRRSEEHTSELQSRQYLVCRLLLEQNTATQGHRPV